MILCFKPNSLINQRAIADLQHSRAQQVFNNLHRRVREQSSSDICLPHEDVDVNDKCLYIIALDPDGSFLKQNPDIFTNTLLAGNLIEHVEQICFLVADIDPDDTLSDFIVACLPVLSDCNLDNGIQIKTIVAENKLSLLEPPLVSGQAWKIHATDAAIDENNPDDMARYGLFVTFQLDSTECDFSDIFNGGVCHYIPGRDEKFAHATDQQHMSVAL